MKEQILKLIDLANKLEGDDTHLFNGDFEIQKSGDYVSFIYFDEKLNYIDVNKDSIDISKDFVNDEALMDTSVEVWTKMIVEFKAIEDGI